MLKTHASKEGHSSLGAEVCCRCLEKVKLCDMDHHDQSHHDEALPLSCDECEYKDHTVKGLTSHKRRIHGVQPKTGSEKVQCPHCPVMVVASAMQMHIVNHHSKELPYACSVCQFRSLTKLAVDAHFGIHHKSHKDKVTCQNGCGKSFTQACQMRNHMKRFCQLSSVKDDLVRQEKADGRFQKRKALTKVRRQKYKEELSMLGVS